MVSGCDITIQMAAKIQNNNETEKFMICEEYVEDMDEMKQFQKELNLDAIHSLLLKLYMELNFVSTFLDTKDKYYFVHHFRMSLL